MLAPSTGHSIRGRAGSPLKSSSIAPKPPDQHVFQHLLDHRAERVLRIRLLEVQRQRGNPFGRIGQIAEHASVPRLDAPLHSRDAVLDGVDGFARDRHLGEAAQIMGVGLGMTPARTSVGAPGVNMVGRGTVLRAGKAPVAASAAGADWRSGQCWLRNADPAERAPAKRRSAPRNVSRMFMIVP